MKRSCYKLSELIINEVAYLENLLWQITNLYLLIHKNHSCSKCRTLWISVGKSFTLEFQNYSFQVMNK